MRTIEKSEHESLKQYTQRLKDLEKYGFVPNNEKYYTLNIFEIDHLIEKFGSDNYSDSGTVLNIMNLEKHLNN